jgi:hypothetical protein
MVVIVIYSAFEKLVYFIYLSIKNDNNIFICSSDTVLIISIKFCIYQCDCVLKNFLLITG